MSYLGELTLRLAAGAMRLPEDFRRRHSDFMLSAKAEDGGFAGREGEGDLYYTGFAVRGLALLGSLDPPTARDTAQFIQRRLTEELPAIDFLSLVYTAVLLELTHGIDVFAQAKRDRRRTVVDTLDRFRRPDGGYAKTVRSGQGSTYHTFLAVACKQLVGAEVEDPDQISGLIRSRRRDDGGFVELGPLKDGGTNPTAAAIGLLRMLDAMEDGIRRPAVDFLVKMQTAEGGLAANTRIPLADLLSTFTGTVALADLDGLAALDLDRVTRYVAALEQPQGGFRGGAWDDAADVEYTFYGLGLSALLAAEGR